MEQAVPNYHLYPVRKTQKSPASYKAGLILFGSCCDQPRVRERIMKLSKVYSATCHRKYSSER